MKNIGLRLFFLFAVIAPAMSQDVPWIALSHTDEMTDAKSIGFVTITTVPSTNNEVRLTVNCEDAKGKSGLMAFLNAEHSVIDNSAEYLSKWRFDTGTPGIVRGWHRVDDGSLIYIKGDDASKFINMLAATNTLKVQLPMFSVGMGDGYPVLSFSVFGLGEKLDGHCGFQKPTLTAEQSKALKMDTVSANSEAAKTSPAAAAAMAHDGHMSTPQELADAVKAGRASKCAVITDPPGADIFIDGNTGGTTPLVFILGKRESPRVIEIKLAGYKTVEQTVDPNGKDIPIAIKLQKEVK